jgi:hypothetical protein
MSGDPQSLIATFWNNSLRLEHIQFFVDFITEGVWYFSLFMEDWFSFVLKAQLHFDSWNTTNCLFKHFSVSGDYVVDAVYIMHTWCSWIY